MTEKEILLTSILNCPAIALYTEKFFLNSEQQKRLDNALYLRSQGVPLQYILGEVEFFGLNFKVDKRAFIPRPETELLVEIAMKRAENRNVKIETILEVGTGSGCISISLAKFFPWVKVTALDISFEALSLAKENSQRNFVGKNISFIQSDLLSALRYPCLCGMQALSAYDLIISNPPYVCSGDIKNLQPELRYEPLHALDGGEDGLDFYRRLIKDAPGFMKREGLLVMEIGFGQRKGIEAILYRHGTLKLIEVIKDYSGIERVMVLEHG